MNATGGSKWPMVALGEVCQIVSGSTPKSGTPAYWDGDVLWATPKDLSNLDGDYISQPARNISIEGLKSCSSRLLPPNSVLLSSRAPIGLVAINTKQMATNQGFKSLVPKPDSIYPKYLLHWLKSQRLQLQTLGNGATFKEISKATVSSIQIPLPPLDEQKRIAAILDKADGLRRKRRDALALLDTLTQSIFVEMFGDRVARGKTQTLSDCVTFLTSGGRGWAKYYAEDGPRFIRSLDVQMNAIGRDDVAFVNPPENAEAKRTKICSGDVLLTITGSKIGRSAVAKGDAIGGFISQHVAIIRLDCEQLKPTFLSHFLCLEDGGQKQIQQKQYGQAKPGLNFRQIRSFEIPKASLEEQQKFLQQVEQHSTLRAAYEKDLTHLDALFTSLQSRAFSGQL